MLGSGIQMGRQPLGLVCHPHWCDILLHDFRFTEGRSKGVYDDGYAWAANHCCAVISDIHSLWTPVATISVDRQGPISRHFRDGGPSSHHRHSL